MRTLLLAYASLLALSTSAGTASAMPTTTFAYTGGFQSYTVPTTGLYDILAIGGQGGSLFNKTYPDFPTYVGQTYYFGGGTGAKIGGDFELTAGETLSIAVGGNGSPSNGGNDSSSNGGGGEALWLGQTARRW